MARTTTLTRRNREFLEDIIAMGGTVALCSPGEKRMLPKLRAAGYVARYYRPFKVDITDAGRIAVMAVQEKRR